MKDYFALYREKIIGYQSTIDNNKKKNVIYADWCGSGKLYEPIEQEILQNYAPYYSNIHSTGNSNSDFIAKEYYYSKAIIKKHFGANEDYFLCVNGQGMTMAINQCIEIIKLETAVPNDTIVIVSPYEHNSNFITWIENGYDVNVLELDEDGNLDFDYYDKILEKYHGKKKIIISITACSNVTGILMDIEKISKIGKEYGALIFIDYTACAPYTTIDITKNDIDVLVCSMHKFVGGVQGIGVLLMRKSLYKRKSPSRPGGGTVRWVNPYGEILYLSDEDQREEAGTVPILQTIRSRLAIELKENIGIAEIKKRELNITKTIFEAILGNKRIKMFTPNIENRLPVFSFNVLQQKFTKTQKDLNDIFGIYVRGGCCCASIFAHKFLKISEVRSKEIYRELRENEKSRHKMGWVRISLNYITSDRELERIKEGIENIGC